MTRIGVRANLGVTSRGPLGVGLGPSPARHGALAWRAAIDARSTDEGASEADTAMAIPADGLDPAPRIAWSASPAETTEPPRWAGFRRELPRGEGAMFTLRRLLGRRNRSKRDNRPRSDLRGARERARHRAGRTVPVRKPREGAVPYFETPMASILPVLVGSCGSL